MHEIIEKKNQSWHNKQNNKISKYLFIGQMLQKPTLHHWQKLQSEYFTLTQMAANVLIVPVTNVDVEWDFSIIWQIINYIKTWLLSEIIKRLIMLKNFSSINTIKREKSWIKKLDFYWIKKQKLIKNIKLNFNNILIDFNMSMFIIENNDLKNDSVINVNNDFIVDVNNMNIDEY